MVSMQYQPYTDWNIELNTLYSVLNANNSNQNFLWQPSSVFDRNGHISAYQLIDNTLVQGTYSKVLEINDEEIPFNTSMEAIWRKSAIKTSLAHLIVEYNIDYWQTKYQIGFTQASGGTSQDHTSQWSANTDFSVDFRSRKNIVTSYQTSRLSASDWQISEVRKDSQDSTDSEIFAQADFEYQLDQPFIQSVKFGGKYKQHQRDFIRFR